AALATVLLEAGDLPVQICRREGRVYLVVEIDIKKICKCISRSPASLNITKGIDSLGIARCGADRRVVLVALVNGPLRSELQIVAVERFCKRVAEAVCGTCMLPGNIGRIDVESQAAVRGIIARNRNSRQLRRAGIENCGDAALYLSHNVWA